MTLKQRENETEVIDRQRHRDEETTRERQRHKWEKNSLIHSSCWTYFIKYSAIVVYEIFGRSIESYRRSMTSCFSRFRSSLIEINCWIVLSTHHHCPRKSRHVRVTRISLVVRWFLISMWFLCFYLILQLFLALSRDADFFSIEKKSQSSRIRLVK